MDIHDFEISQAEESDSDDVPQLFRDHLKRRAASSDSEEEEMKKAKPLKKRGRPRKLVKKPQGPKSKNWCLTGSIDKITEAFEGKCPTLEDYFNKNDSVIRYICGKKEKPDGKDEDEAVPYVHYQVYVQTHKTIRATGLQKIFPAGQWRNGPMYKNSSPEKCILYTKKEATSIEGEEWVCFGEPPTSKGRSSALVEAAEEFLQSGNKQAVWKAHPTPCILHGDKIERWAAVINSEPTHTDHELKDYLEGDHPWTPLSDKDFEKTIILYGEASSGKSHFARANFQERGWTWIEVNNRDDIGNWAGQDAILFDDIDGWAKDLTRTDVISLVEHRDQRSFKIRYKNVTIPGHVKKIITTNAKNGCVFDYDLMRNEKSVYRRYRRKHLLGSHNPDDNDEDLDRMEEDEELEDTSRLVYRRNQRLLQRHNVNRAVAEVQIPEMAPHNYEC